MVTGWFMGTLRTAIRALIREELRCWLISMATSDQHVRFRLMRLMGGARDDPGYARRLLRVASELRQTDARNRSALRAIISQYGWPGQSLVGSRGAYAAWLLAQHCDSDRHLQTCCLQLLGQAVARGDANPQQLAYLTDRTLVARGLPQVYGTQYQCNCGHEPVQHPVTNGDTLETRRREAGLPPSTEARMILGCLLTGTARGWHQGGMQAALLHGYSGLLRSLTGVLKRLCPELFEETSQPTIQPLNP